jgi:hypothetical protein
MIYSWVNFASNYKYMEEDESYSPTEICEASVMDVGDNTKWLRLLCVIKQHRILSCHSKYHPVWKCKHRLPVPQLKKQGATSHCYCVLVI